MKTVIDKTGRIVIPFSIRNDLNLTPGSILEIDLKGEIIVLQPEKKESLIEKNGITLVCSEWIGEPDISKILEKQRSDRFSDFFKS